MANKLDKLLQNKLFKVRGKDNRATPESAPAHRRACARYYSIVDDFRSMRAEGKDFEVCPRSLHIFHLPTWEIMAKVHIDDNYVGWNQIGLRKLGLDVGNGGGLIDLEEDGEDNVAGQATSVGPQDAALAPLPAMGIGKSAPKKKGKGGEEAGKPAGAQKRAAEHDLEQELRENEEHDGAKQDAEMAEGIEKEDEAGREDGEL